MGVTALDDASCPTALGQIRVDGSSMFGFKSIEARFPCPPRQEWPKTPQPPSPLDLAPALNEKKKKKGGHEKCIFNLVNERLTSALRQMKRVREKKKKRRTGIKNIYFQQLFFFFLFFPVVLLQGGIKIKPDRVALPPLLSCQKVNEISPLPVSRFHTTTTVLPNLFPLLFLGGGGI